MATDIKVENNVPVPAFIEGARKFPFNTMAVGDSFLINGYDPTVVRTAAAAYGKAHKQKFTVRKTPEGHRCWRYE